MNRSPPPPSPHCELTHLCDSTQPVFGPDTKKLGMISFPLLFNVKRQTLSARMCRLIPHRYYNHTAFMTDPVTSDTRRSFVRMYYVPTGVAIQDRSHITQSHVEHVCQVHDDVLGLETRSEFRFSTTTLTRSRVTPTR